MEFTRTALPEVLVLLLPAACLMGVLISLSGFARRNELTAMFASGVSLARIAFVLMSLVFMLCCVSFVVTDRVVPLEQIASVTMGKAPSAIQHANGKRMMVVAANAQGRSSGEVTGDALKIVKQIQFPPGFGVELAGDSHDQQEVFGSLAEAQKVHFNDGGQFDKLYTVK